MLSKQPPPCHDGCGRQLWTRAQLAQPTGINGPRKSGEFELESIPHHVNPDEIQAVPKTVNDVCKSQQVWIDAMNLMTV